MRANVIGTSLAIITNVTLADLQKLQNKKPEALCLYEGEGKEKHEVFRVAAGSKAGINAFSITFNAETNNEPKYAMMNVDISAKPEDVNVTEYVAEKYGKALLYLSQLEENFCDALDCVDAEAAHLASLIQVSL